MDWAGRRELRPLRQVSGATLLWGLCAIGAGAGLASLVIYRARGYDGWMLLLWLLGLAALSLFFWSRGRVLPRIAMADLFVAAGLALIFAPLYLLALYRWPVQVSSDEVHIINAAKSYADPVRVDPFGVSTYIGRPALLFIGWGNLGELFGGFDLYHMRLLHAVFGLLTIAASYALLRQLLPRGWAIFGTFVLGGSHSFFMISRLAMRENTSVLVEVVALTLLLWGLRNNHPLATFWGGVVAGLGFYVYQSARATMPLWIVFLLAVGLLSRRRFAVRRLVGLGAVAVAGFVLMATPILIAESKAPTLIGLDSQRETLMIYPEARRLQQQWVHASSIADGYKTNVKWGLTTYNNKISDHAFIYDNRGHGFVDPLTGILLWLGVGLVGVRLVRRRADEGAILVLAGFLVLWVALAFAVNKAPNYTRLLITLPFVAYFVTQAVRWLAERWRSVPYAPAVLVGATLCALVSWNLAIARDYIQEGRVSGEPIGSTGRYAASLSHVPGQRFYVATSEAMPYNVWGGVGLSMGRVQLFAKNKTVASVDPTLLRAFEGSPPFALFMRREVWGTAAPELADAYPQGRIRNVTPDGTRVVLEVPAEQS